jgi:hypothetical protein
MCGLSAKQLAVAAKHSARVSIIVRDFIMARFCAEGDVLTFGVRNFFILVLLWFSCLVFLRLALGKAGCMPRKGERLQAICIHGIAIRGSLLSGSTNFSEIIRTSDIQ